MSIIPGTAQPGAMWAFCWLTFSIFADKVVLGAAIVVTPLEKETTFVRWCRGLVVQNHTHITPTRWLIPVPVPTANKMHKFLFEFLIHRLLLNTVDISSIVHFSLDPSHN